MIVGNAVNEDSCAFYLSSFILDSLLGVFCCWGMHKILLYFVNKYQSKLYRLKSGEYGNPISPLTYFCQLFVWIGIVLSSKLVVFPVLWLIRIPLLFILKYILWPIRQYQELELVMVLFVLPLIINTTILWIQDQFLKVHKKIKNKKNKNNNENLDEISENEGGFEIIDADGEKYGADDEEEDNENEQLKENDANVDINEDNIDVDGKRKKNKKKTKSIKEEEGNSNTKTKSKSKKQTNNRKMDKNKKNLKNKFKMTRIDSQESLFDGSFSPLTDYSSDSEMNSEFLSSNTESTQNNITQSDNNNNNKDNNKDNNNKFIDYTHSISSKRRSVHLPIENWNKIQENFSKTQNLPFSQQSPVSYTSNQSNSLSSPYSIKNAQSIYQQQQQQQNQQQSLSWRSSSSNKQQFLDIPGNYNFTSQLNEQKSKIKYPRKHERKNDAKNKKSNDSSQKQTNNLKNIISNQNQNNNSQDSVLSFDKQQNSSQFKDSSIISTPLQPQSSQSQSDEIQSSSVQQQSANDCSPNLISISNTDIGSNSISIESSESKNEITKLQNEQNQLNGDIKEIQNEKTIKSDL